MKKIRNPRTIRKNVISSMMAIVFIVVGLLISLPFNVVVMYMGYNFHHVTFPVFLMILGFLIGAPMSLFGAINLLSSNRNNTNASTTDLDIARIRYTVEKNGR